jgi:hypothetical protein
MTPHNRAEVTNNAKADARKPNGSRKLSSALISHDDNGSTAGISIRNKQEVDVSFLAPL